MANKILRNRLFSRIWLVFLALLFNASTFAQSQHLAYKNISIEGELGAFTEQLKGLGYSDFYYEHQSFYGMQGMYEGKDCKFLIMHTSETNTVCKVLVTYPLEGNWKAIKKDFASLKKKISKDYGKPVTEVEEFVAPYKEGDKRELSAVRTGKCNYKTLWRIDGSYILLKLNSNAISVIYEDSINTALYSKELEQTNLKRQKWFASEFARRKASLEARASKDVPEYFTGDFPLEAATVGNDRWMEFVDLGLPSGTKWASCNLGAKTPSDFGNHRMWCGLYENPRSFDESYCYSLYTIKEKGLADWQGILTAAGDLATTKLGKDWSMPSTTQFEELMDSSYCHWEKAKLNGVNGFMVFSKTNLNHIFLPAGGYRGHNSDFVKNLEGYYWTNRAETSHARSAYALVFDTSSRRKASVKPQSSYDGCSIRPITYLCADTLGYKDFTIASERYFKFGSVKVDGVPSGAIVKVDGKNLGMVPCQIDSLSVGKHKIEILSEGYQVLKTETEVAENDCSSVSFELAAAPVVEIKKQEEDCLASDANKKPTKEYKPNIIEKYDKFENYYEAMAVSRLSRDVFCQVTKRIKGKSVRYTMLWEVLSPTCLHKSPVKMILLFKDGSKKIFNVDMDTDVYKDPISDRICYSYTVAEYIPLETVRLLSSKELDAIKLYIFEEGLTDSDKNKQFMADLKELINAKRK